LTCKYARALVTGGAGFIGSHIADRLLENGFEVTVLDDLSNARLENINAHTGRSDFHFIEGDIRDLETVKKAVRKVDVVFHEAAFVGVQESIRKPLLTNDVNVNGTLNLLEASLQSNVKRLILASSAAVYGEPQASPISEDSPVHLNSPYAVSKLTSEHYAKAYHKIYGLETICLRYFNVYGPRQTTGPYAAVITSFIDDLLKNKRPTIYGDGEQTRDFINVRDVVQANILAMEKDCAGETFNVAAGSSATINNLLEIMKRIVGKSEVEPKHGAPRPHDIRESCGDISKAKKILGFTPKISLEDGLTDLVKYYEQTTQNSR
jgi:nucleoside-diphosphate-sugar epimerase